MPRKIVYRKQLLRAVEAFLEGSPAASMRAHHLIQRGSVAINREFDTLDNFIWATYFHALKDSVFYEDKEFLQETRELLLGKSMRNATRMVYSLDCRRDFTTDEAEWYTLLMSMIEVLQTVPFAKISQATAHHRENVKDWRTLFTSLPEAVQLAKIDEAYQQKKALVAEILARNPSPENIGDEKISHLVLREITSFLSEIDITIASAYLGHPILCSHHTIYEGITTINEYPDITENILWAKRVLEALTGQGAFFLSWRLSKAASFDGYALVISLH